MKHLIRFLILLACFACEPDNVESIDKTDIDGKDGIEKINDTLTNNTDTTRYINDSLSVLQNDTIDLTDSIDDTIIDPDVVNDTIHITDTINDDINIPDSIDNSVHLPDSVDDNIVITDTINHTHLLFAGKKTWDTDDIHSVYYQVGELDFWNPESWTEPDYFNGNLYMRFEVLEKASDATLNMQLCLWYGIWSNDGKCELCVENWQMPWFTFSKEGDVVYLKYPPFSQWKHLHGREWDTEEIFKRMLFQMRLGNKQVKLGDDSHHLGEEAELHLPVKWHAEAYIVPVGESFAIPEHWTGNPWGEK